MKIEELDLDVRQYNMLKRAGIDTTEDFINYPDKERLKKLTGRTYGVMEELLRTGTIPDENISAPAPAQTETAVVFDYSELDGETAEQLGKISENVINIKKKYIFDMAEQVKKAHDLLANHYGGKFGAWCESVGISRRTGEMLNNVAKQFRNISSEQRQNLEKLTDGNVKLLYEAARPSAPAELVEAVKNGDITTHKEYIALKKQLEEANEQLEQQKINNQHLSEANDRIYAASKRNREDYDKERLKALELQKRVEELESRPVEVAVEQDTAAIAERDERIAELEEQLRSRDCELDFGNNNASCDKMSEFYEMLHGKALNALKDCMAFIRSDGLPQTVKNRAVGRFGTLKDLIEMYIDELEEI